MTVCPWLVIWMLVASACGTPRPLVRPVEPLASSSWATVEALDFFAQRVFLPTRVGGLSGLTYDPVDGDWIAVSDARRMPAWIGMGIRLRPGRVDVDVHRTVRVKRPAGLGPTLPDFEAVVVLPNGHLLIASEGDRAGGVRVPVAIWEYDRQGRPVSQMRVPEKFLPETPGGAPRGLRDNNGFEGMALDPRSSRLWMVSEVPLLQDDDLADLDRGARARMVEISIAGGSFTVTRELIYPIDAVGRALGPPPGAAVIDQGVSELTLLPGGVLVSMERAFLRDTATGWSANVVRLFRLDVDDADDVSGMASLRNASSARPVRKRLLADLSTFAPRLDPRLRALENFEAAAPGPPTPDGRPTLLVLSDDNFSQRQVTAMLVLAARP